MTHPVAGNVYNKYESKSPIARRLMQGFLRDLDALAQRAKPTSIHEVGCGEGYLSARLRALLQVPVRGSDGSPDIIAHAQKLHGTIASFAHKDIYTLTAAEDAADLVVCCEVLEHLERPEDGLRVLSTIARGHCIMSVPREPLWRVLNMARGAYLRDFGNTPGHLQHWSARRFVAFVETAFDVVEVRHPLPWTMVLARARV